MKFSILIVDFFKAAQIAKNLPNFIFQSSPQNLEILIFDNSCDAKNAAILKNLEKKFANLRIFFGAKNRGYSAANNFLVQKARGEFLIISNGDIFLPTKNIFKNLEKILRENSKIGILGARQISQKTGEIETAVARKFPNFAAQIARHTFLKNIFPFRNLISKYEMRDFDFYENADVDWLQSSFWFLRRNFFEKCGGFDERFFIFAADIDFCARVRNFKKTVFYCGEIEIFSDGIRASSGGFLNFFRSKILRIHFFDLVKFFWKHRGGV